MKKVLITGGSSGIGFEMSKHFARGGYQLIWVAKPLEELQTAKRQLEELVEGVSIQILAKDLSLPNAANEVYEWTSNNNWDIDVLINNAGFGTYGFTENVPVEKELAMIHLNVLCLYQLSRLYLNDMIKKDRGTIINISSNSSFQPVPRMNTYASTKAFVRHFSMGLQEELTIMGSKVKVLTVCPSAVKDTPFKKVANAEKVKTFEGLAYTTAEEVGQDVWKAFRNGKTFLVTGAKMRFWYALTPLLPGFLKRMLVRMETEEGGEL